MEPTQANKDLNDFCRTYSKATWMLKIAADDYASARCLILSGLLGGLILGSQALEKLLKAYLLFHDRETPVKRLSHSLTRLLRSVRETYPTLSLDQFEEVASRFERHYEARYPDNPNSLASKTGLEINDLDRFVIYLNENLPCPKNVRFRTGLYAIVTSSFELDVMPPWEFWIKTQNEELARLLPQISSEYVAVLEEIHPGIFESQTKRPSEQPPKQPILQFVNHHLV
ncbi:MAG: HEPN domain-containing protein [Acidobacteriota bacterium]